MRAKPPKGLTPLARRYAENVGRLAGKGERGAEVRLAATAKLSRSAAHRALAGTNATLATMQRIATGYGLEPWELLHPALTPSPEPSPKARMAELQEEVIRLRAQLEQIQATVRAFASGVPTDSGRGAARLPDAGQADRPPGDRVNPDRK